MLIENQSLFFMQKRFSSPVYVYFEFAFVLAVESFVFLLVDGKIKEGLWKIILILFFGALSMKVVRGFPLFGLFFAPVVAENLYDGIWRRFELRQNFLNGIVMVLSASILLFGLVIERGLFSPIDGRTGLGLIKNINASAEFFKDNALKGPVFNNYDIGGYLIYHLFPKEKVFVDNRPEAYSVSFFENQYIPMQENENVWKEMNEKYGFNIIFFYRKDITPWAQPFLIRRIEDSDWVPVFVDNFALILAKNNEINKEIIEKYRLPKGIFVVTR